ncbi:hypothetical protein, partial [Nocardioides sp.]|uniref:hypothetical protein n=1 Tax=Nocardioides sp. TaxID=35761 RepID=UPI002CE46AFE
MTPDTALTPAAPAPSATISNGVVSKRLLDRLAAGTPFAVAFGGQGADWLEPLAELVRVHR